MNQLMGTVARKPITFISGAGPYLISSAGESYLDFFCDVGTSSLGYCSEWQRNILHIMLDGRIPFHAPNLFGFALRDAAAAELCAATDMDRVFFCNSGTEAVEAAIKLARKYQSFFGRSSVWSYNGGFHGRTYGALAAGDGPKHHYEGFGALPRDFYHFTAIGEIDFRASAAVILAPVFGNGDVREYSRDWLIALRDECHRNKTLLIFDEVQTGAGRSGAFFTYSQLAGIEPDIITLAKGLGMGIPVGAMLARGDVSNAFTVGSHFSTFGGNPISCVSIRQMVRYVGNSVFERGGVAATLWAELSALDWVKKLRGPGMLLAFDTDVDTMELAAAALENKLLIGAFHPGPGVVKITPPLNITHEQVREGVKKLDNAYRACRHTLSAFPPTG